MLSIFGRSYTSVSVELTWSLTQNLILCSISVMHLTKHTCDNPWSLSWTWILRGQHELNVLSCVQGQHWSRDFQSGLLTWKRKKISLIAFQTVFVYLNTINKNSHEAVEWKKSGARYRYYVSTKEQKYRS